MSHYGKTIELEWIEKVNKVVNLKTTGTVYLIILSWKLALIWNTIFTMFIAAPNIN